MQKIRDKDLDEHSETLRKGSIGEIIKSINPVSSKLKADRVHAQRHGP